MSNLKKSSEIFRNLSNSLVTLASARLKLNTACGHRIGHRKWKKTKQQPNLLPNPAVPGCSLVSYFRRPTGGTRYHNLFMFVAKQTSPDHKKRSDWSKLPHT